jgi:guanine deaminase
MSWFPSEEHTALMETCISLASENVRSGRGGPFAALIVKNGQIIAHGINRVTSDNDPTAHAEVVAIRNACLQLGTYILTGAEIYSSCEPCPMCFGAIYWAGIERVYYGATRTDASLANFRDAHIYKEICKHPIDRQIPFYHIPVPNVLTPFALWDSFENKAQY